MTEIGELPRLKTGPHRAGTPARDSCGVGTAERLGKDQMDAGVENQKCHPKQSKHLLHLGALSISIVNCKVALSSTHQSLSQIENKGREHAWTALVQEPSLSVRLCLG